MDSLTEASYLPYRMTIVHFLCWQTNGNQGGPKTLRVLNHYVKHTLPIEHNITPISTDRAFYPLPNDIKNHVDNAKRALELSKLDQKICT